MEKEFESWMRGTAIVSRAEMAGGRVRVTDVAARLALVLLNTVDRSVMNGGMVGDSAYIVRLRNRSEAAVGGVGTSKSRMRLTGGLK